MKRKRAVLVDRAIRLVYSSLESHLYYTHHKNHEGQKFHQQCVKEYAHLIKILSKLY